MEDETRNTEVQGETSTSGERLKCRGKTENMTAKEQIEKKAAEEQLNREFLENRRKHPLFLTLSQYQEDQ